MVFSIEEARTYIASVKWQFAKTMPHIPHWYTLRKWRPDLDDDFVNLVLLIRAAGVQRPWPEPPAKPIYHNHYLTIDGWKCWTMGAPVHFAADPATLTENLKHEDETILINRAAATDQATQLAGGAPQPS
jgi:hypothetical protein